MQPADPCLQNSRFLRRHALRHAAGRRDHEGVAGHIRGRQPASTLYRPHLEQLNMLNMLQPAPFARVVAGDQECLRTAVYEPPGYVWEVHIETSRHTDSPERGRKHVGSVAGQPVVNERDRVNFDVFADQPAGGIEQIGRIAERPVVMRIENLLRAK